MSEPLLKAILRLFALVAKEDEVTDQERDQIEYFWKITSVMPQLTLISKCLMVLSETLLLRRGTSPLK